MSLQQDTQARFTKLKPKIKDWACGSVTESWPTLCDAHFNLQSRENKALLRFGDAKIQPIHSLPIPQFLKANFAFYNYLYLPPFKNLSLLLVYIGRVNTWVLVHIEVKGQPQVSCLLKYHLTWICLVLFLKRSPSLAAWPVSPRNLPGSICPGLGLQV